MKNGFDPLFDKRYIDLDHKAHLKDEALRAKIQADIAARQAEYEAKQEVADFLAHGQGFNDGSADGMNMAYLGEFPLGSHIPSKNRLTKPPAGGSALAYSKGFSDGICSGYNSTRRLIERNKGMGPPPLPGKGNSLDDLLGNPHKR